MPGQREAVDVVDEEQDVAAFVAEALGHREARQRDAQAVARRLVHLPEHHRHLRLGEVFLHDDLGVRHLVIEVVALPRALAHAGEHGQAGVLHGDVVDELQHVHGLAHTGAAEEADLAAFGERADEVHDLDARLEQLDRWRQLVELRCILVDRATLVTEHRTTLVDRPPEHVHHAAEHAGADGNADRLRGVAHLHATLQSVRGAERDRAHDAIAELLLHLEREALLDQRVAGVGFEHQRVVHPRHAFARELDVHHRSDALHYRPLAYRRRIHVHSLRSETVWSSVRRPPRLLDLVSP